MTNDSAYDDIIGPLAASSGVPVALVKGIIAEESGFNPNATNTTGSDGARGGAFGLMQVTMTTALGMGFSGSDDALRDPTTNLTLGIRFLGYAFEQADGDWGRTASIYNGGKSLGDGTYSDQSYVSAVLNYAQQYGGTPLSSSGQPLPPPASATNVASAESLAAFVGAAIIAGIVWASR